MVSAVLWQINSAIGKPLVFCLLCEDFLQPLGFQIFINWPTGSDLVLDNEDEVMDETDKVPFLMELTF